MKEANKYMLIDTALALLVAFLINLAVISCFAEIFYSSGTLTLPLTFVTRLVYTNYMVLQYIQ